MSTNDPKPARRIPDEGLFTVHFSGLGRDDASFEAQVPEISEEYIDRAFRKHANTSRKYLTYYMPSASHPGNIYAGHNKIGTFTITPPTLKGDPDEPT